MLRIIWFLTLVAFVAFSSGCAQIVRGSKTPIVVNSTPSGALVQLSTGEECETPCVLRVDRKSSASMRITMDGYRPATALLLSEFNVAWFLLDLIMTGPFAFISFAGGLYDVKPDAVLVTLLPVTGRTDLKPKVVRLHCNERNAAQASCSITEVNPEK